MKTSKQPIVFNIQYTPYRLPSNATSFEVEKHKERRAFYDMSADKNVYKYINTEGKRSGKMTALKYLQKNTGVFNGDNFIQKEEVEKMIERVQTGEKNIWHGFISFDEENSHKIDTPHKCMEIVKKTFPYFFTSMGLDKNNIDLMCALHLDKPKHLHIHFVFWEKEPKCKYRKKELEYRHKGKIDSQTLDQMHQRLNMFLRDRTHLEARQDALNLLRTASQLREVVKYEDIKKALIKMSESLPKDNEKLYYNSAEMEKFRPQIDEIVKLVLSHNKEARKIHMRFIEKLEKCEKADKTYIDKVKKDYVRRQGNIVLSTAKRINPQLLRRRKKTYVNDNSLKRKIAISTKRIDGLFGKMINAFTSDIEIIQSLYVNRLREIEQEMENEKFNQVQKIKSKYNWGK